MSNYSVYMLVSPNKKRYIGMTRQKVSYRWNYGKGYKENAPLWNDIIKYGWDRFEKYILEEGLTEGQASRKEQIYIALFGTQNPETGYNREMGGKHFKMAEQTKAKMSLAHIGQIRDEEYRKHISESKRGIKNGMFGRFGSLSPNASKVIAIKDGEEIRFGSICDAARKLNLSKNAFKNISACCKGKRRSAYGYVWRYEDDR